MSIAVPAARCAGLRVKAAVLLAVLVAVLSVQSINPPEAHAWDWRDTTKAAIATYAVTSFCWGIAGGLAVPSGGASLAFGVGCNAAVGIPMAAAMEGSRRRRR